MDEPGVYLEKLTAFARILRREGLPIGLQETADAAAILLHTGFADRSLVKTALRTVFARSREEQLTFDRAFDGFFLPEAAIRQQAREQAQQDMQTQQILQQARQTMRWGDQQMELTREQWQTYASLPEQERQRLEGFMEKYRNNAERNPELYGAFIHSVFAKAILEQQLLLEDAGVGVAAIDPELGLLYRDISRFTDTQIPRAVALIQTVARQLNGELDARRRAGGHTGKPDFRRTIRKGLETGGSLHRLCYRKKPVRRRSLVLLCDVSGSMMQFSEFALRFIQSLNRVADNARVFLFSERLWEADAFALEDMDKFRNYVRQSGLYGRGTDLGTALELLTAARPAVLGPSTTLIVLSDTKTIDQGRAVAALQTARRQAGKVLWLNPLPRSRWRYLRSVQTFAGLCSMLPCGTLSDLADACRRLT